MARTRTITQQQQEPHSYYSLDLKGRVTPPNESAPEASTSRLSTTHEPLLRLDSYESEQLTPAIGVRFDAGLRLTDIMALDKQSRAPFIRQLAVAISRNGVAFFRDQHDLTADQLAQLTLELGEQGDKHAESSLHIHPTQELGENGLPVGKISSKADASGRQISFADERSKFASAGWHSDISFEPVPAAYSSLKMHTIPKTGGDTLFSSSYAHYEMLSPSFREYLATLTASHNAEMFKRQSERHGYKLFTGARGHPDNTGDHFESSHPVVRTNPVTGWRTLFVNKTFTNRIDGLTYDESEALLNYLFTLQTSSHDAQVRYKWQPHDLAIWDNRACLHSATFDFGDAYRAGDRAVVVGEKPYFDPRSLSRSEADSAIIES